MKCDVTITLDSGEEKLSVDGFLDAMVECFSNAAVYIACAFDEHRDMHEFRFNGEAHECCGCGYPEHEQRSEEGADEELMLPLSSLIELFEKWDFEDSNWTSRRVRSLLWKMVRST